MYTLNHENCLDCNCCKIEKTKFSEYLDGSLPENGYMIICGRNQGGRFYKEIPKYVHFQHGKLCRYYAGNILKGGFVLHENA